MKMYHKLVRDKIPNIIEASGRHCSVRTLTTEEYITALDTKLNEEVAEYQVDKSLEEMADVLEVLQALCIARGYSLKDLENARSQKAEQRGAFQEKVFLEYVE